MDGISDFARMKKQMQKQMTESFTKYVFDDERRKRRDELNAAAYGSSSSAPTPRRTIERNREEGAQKLFEDYFDNPPKYPLELFRRRFRMQRDLFVKIVDELGEKYEYFRQGYDAIGKPGLSPLQKCTSAIRMLAYGGSADSVDEYVRIGETTALECLHKFCEGIIVLYEGDYLRKPNQDDVTRLMQMGEDRGFPGMMGSIDCMHWQWKNCPKAWKGQYMNGYKGVPTMILEAVASPDLWIWHAFFGVAGSNNDLNVLDRSPLFSDLLQGRAPKVNYNVSGTEYNMGYYLTDGIYPRWATFVKSIPQPQGPRRKKFAERHEFQRKDVERAFGVLQSRWAIIRNPARGWDYNKLGNIMRACIIMHNMIVEDERDFYTGNFPGQVPAQVIYNDQTEPIHQNEGNCTPYEIYRANLVRVRATAEHQRLQEDLINHMWEFNARN